MYTDGNQRVILLIIHNAYVSAAFVGGVTHHVIGMQLKLIIEDESFANGMRGDGFFNPHGAKTMPTDGKP